MPGLFFVAGARTSEAAQAGYVRLGGNTGDAAYPLTDGGVTGGDTSAGASGAVVVTAGAGGWNPATDPIVCKWVGEGGGQSGGRILRLRLDGIVPGSRQISVWALNREFSRTRWTLFDSNGTTQLWTQDTVAGTSTAGQFIGTDGVLRALSLFGSNPTVTIAPTGTSVFLQVESPNNVSDFRGLISGYFVSEPGAGGVAAQLIARRRRRYAR